MYIATTLSALVPAARSSEAKDNTLNCVSRYVHVLPDTASIKHGAFGVWSAWAWNAVCTIVGGEEEDAMLAALLSASL